MAGAIETLLDRLIPDPLIGKVLDLIFSKVSLVIHTVWFVFWFLKGQDVSLLTNIVSLEAIYIGILIGIQQLHHHKVMKQHISKEVKK